MFSFDEATKKSIIIGIISSLIVIMIFEPLLSILNKNLLAILSSYSSWLSNSIYSKAALGISYKANTAILMSLYSLVFGYMTGVIVALEKKSKNNDDKLKKPKKYFWIIILMGSLLISFQFQTSIEHKVIDLNLKFQQKLTMVSPYLDNQQEEELRAEWASMKNVNDFNSVNSNLDKYLNLYQETNN